MQSIFAEISGIDFDFKSTGAGVDWLIYALIAIKYEYISYLKDPLVYFHAHPGSITVANHDGLVSTGYGIARGWFAQFVKSL